MTMSSGKYWTFDPKDTTITPCSADWTNASISCGKMVLLYLTLFLVCSVIIFNPEYFYVFGLMYVYVYVASLPFDKGFASFAESPSTEITLGNKGFG